MIFRSATAADIAAVLESYRCSEEVIFNTVRSMDLVETFLDLESYERVTVLYNNEFKFFENHVLQDEVTFSNFYNGLLGALKISDEAELENEDTYDDGEDGSGNDD